MWQTGCGTSFYKPVAVRTGRRDQGETETGPSLKGGRVRRQQRASGHQQQQELQVPERAQEQRQGPQRDEVPAAVVGRRAAGALESAVLGVLWHASAPLSPGEVRETLARTDSAGASLSYSTVVTILTRLHEKGSLSRERDGRAFRYAPVSDEAGLAARRLSQLLDRSPDREAVLSRFVADLSERDEELLRSLLGGGATDESPDEVTE